MSLTTERGVKALCQQLVADTPPGRDRRVFLVSDCSLRMEVPDDVSRASLLAKLKAMPSHAPLVIHTRDLRGTVYALYNGLATQQAPRSRVVEGNGRCVLVKLRPLSDAVITHIVCRVVSRLLPSRFGTVPARHQAWWRRTWGFCAGNGHVAVRRALEYALHGEAAVGSGMHVRHDIFEIGRAHV